MVGGTPAQLAARILGVSMDHNDLSRRSPGPSDLFCVEACLHGETEELQLIQKVQLSPFRSHACHVTSVRREAVGLRLIPSFPTKGLTLESMQESIWFRWRVLNIHTIQ